MVKIGINGCNRIVKDHPFYHKQHGYQFEILLNAWQELCYELVDTNANNQLGVMNIQTTSANRTRQSTNDALLRLIRCKRRNLTIKTETYVTK
ncbi:hypothetical protein K0M31_002248 [Melipona bicolor]|uniref:Uncharacterized protein n=1 Tax=Melipona bicolor TaxID=60889 RepID=A0AA40GHV0_9HYME|nr:hypothetical protein K0M31_002248 [Melipona bicolor]